MTKSEWGKLVERRFKQACQLLGLQFESNGAKRAWDILPEGTGWNSELSGVKINIKQYSTNWMFGSREIGGAIPFDKEVPKKDVNKYATIIHDVVRVYDINNIIYLKPASAEIEKAIVRLANHKSKRQAREGLINIFKGQNFLMRRYPTLTADFPDDTPEANTITIHSIRLSDESGKRVAYGKKPTNSTEGSTYFRIANKKDAHTKPVALVTSAIVNVEESTFAVPIDTKKNKLEEEQVSKENLRDFFVKDLDDHCNKVRFLVNKCVQELQKRGAEHDASKYTEAEAPYYEEPVYILNHEGGPAFGSPEYKELTKKMGDGLKHHKEVNRHHPEHFENKIEGMNLVDIVEMVCDWIAASNRKSGKSNNPLDAIKVNREKGIDISPQLEAILRNTVEMLTGGRGIKANEAGEIVTEKEVIEKIQPASMESIFGDLLTRFKLKETDQLGELLQSVDPYLNVDRAEVYVSELTPVTKEMSDLWYHATASKSLRVKSIKIKPSAKYGGYASNPKRADILKRQGLFFIPFVNTIDTEHKGTVQRQIVLIVIPQELHEDAAPMFADPGMTTSVDIKSTPATLAPKKKKIKEASATIDKRRMWELARFYVKNFYAKEKMMMTNDRAIEVKDGYDIEVFIRIGKSPAAQLEFIRDFTYNYYIKFLKSKGFTQRRDTWKTIGGIFFRYQNWYNWNTGIRVTLSQPFRYRSADPRWRVRIKIEKM